ncbi:FliM/FliN family flagellar motor switch protein [Deferribacteraceae bacterium V6Fe1]|uniref:FliM/FliN family flagellar motor switch protein n=1 Tax=Deferrivibrio essentukiensis TaxID=2880922 RepID=UPI001F60131E|nr:FliM/FliN family flagellar motor switch protein [Deferrivibrio essentukiensis]MCB4204835.1 FliM/FliN family flagellar motor switch protein [Deferrivibrio essentukiensis]UOD33809.1 FliM/FliN family flagellar motor switch protein [Deferribacteraceae bacterium V6Fe1]
MIDLENVLNRYGNVLLNVDVELGRKLVSIGEMLSWENGTIIKLSKTSGESVDFLVNKKPVAVGEVMVIDEKFAIRITDVLTKAILFELSKDGLYD